jgi:hypothetical protein
MGDVNLFTRNLSNDATRPLQYAQALTTVQGSDGSENSTFLFTSDPFITNVTESLYQQDVKGTFACVCTRARIEPLQYILSIVDASPAPTPVGNCLNNDIMELVCVTLQSFRMMNCSSVWTSGASGLATSAGVETGVLVDVATREMRRRLGGCASTMSVVGVPDGILLSNTGT